MFLSGLYIKFVSSMQICGRIKVVLPFLPPPPVVVDVSVSVSRRAVLRLALNRV